MTDIPPLRTVIDKLNLMPHPVEGGYFLQTYKANEGTLKAALPDRFSGDRSFATSIYYVIPPDRISSLHVMLADETWHFYIGSAINLVEISPDGVATEITLGPDVAKGQVPQHTVMAGNWLGAYNLEAELYSLVGCTVAPGMELDDYEHGKPKELLKLFPHLKELILKLTWKDDKKPPPYVLPGGN